MLAASIGSATALELGLSPARADEGPDRLTFGALEPLTAAVRAVFARMESAVGTTVKKKSGLMATVTARGAVRVPVTPAAVAEKTAC